MTKLHNQAAVILAAFAASLAVPAASSAADLFSNAALLAKSDAPATCQRRGGEGRRAAPAARAAPAQRPAGSGGGRNVRANASSNVNHNINANRNVNINDNRNVNVNVNNGYGYHDGWDDHYHPIATAAAVTTAAVVTAAVVGSIVYSVPPSCSTVVVNGIGYSQCGSTWYAPRYSGTTVQYVVVNPPR